MLSFHTSPLTQPGEGDSGGMNVYVRELVSALAQAGVECSTYTRRMHRDQPDEVFVEPGHRVVHIDAGSFTVPKEGLPGYVDAFTDGVREHLAASGGTDVLHANYWLSGVAGHRLKHELDLPLVTTFHTLARVKAEGGDPEPAVREQAEIQVIGCADAICVSCAEEEAQACEDRGHVEPVVRDPHDTCLFLERVRRPKKPRNYECHQRDAGRKEN